MKRVLIISYYWPPAGGPGVQRVLKFAKYLPQFGWEPIILTVKDGEYPSRDEDLLQEVSPSWKVFRFPLWEPYQLFRKLSRTGDAPLVSYTIDAPKPGLIARFGKWLRLNVFIPDPKLAMPFLFYKKALSIVDRYRPDIIFSSSPPPSVHLLAFRIHQKRKIPWVADFRDPWSGIFYLSDQKRCILSRKVDQLLEKMVLTTASARVTIGDSLVKRIQPGRSELPFFIIPNGFDPEDFTGPLSAPDYNRFIITHMGTLGPAQNPVQFWHDLAEVIAENPEFREKVEIRFIGHVCGEIMQSLDSAGLKLYSRFMGYIPHRKALQLSAESSLLLVIIPNSRGNEGIVTGKLYEYLALHRPILGIGPTGGDAAKIIAASRSGRMFDFDQSIKPFLLAVFEKWEKREIPLDNLNQILPYSRKENTGKLAALLDSLISSSPQKPTN